MSTSSTEPPPTVSQLLEQKRYREAAQQVGATEAERPLTRLALQVAEFPLGVFGAGLVLINLLMVVKGDGLAPVIVFSVLSILTTLYASLTAFGACAAVLLVARRTSEIVLPRIELRRLGMVGGAVVAAWLLLLGGIVIQSALGLLAGVLVACLGVTLSGLALWKHPGKASLFWLEALGLPLVLVGILLAPLPHPAIGGLVALALLTFAYQHNDTVSRATAKAS
ncbi:MAG: hypothetical protein Q7P63_04420 [Verrucomicrobiota bacterium JB022]|nr:hypothetical protein [Verrucomicrobiota bacterium JB022]